MRKFVFLATLLAIFGAVPSNAQQGEWRFATRVTSLSFDAVTDPIFDTGTQMKSSSATPTLALEWQYMMSEALAICASLTTAPFDFKGVGGEHNGEVLGEIWFTPITLTLRYEFQFRGSIQPYIGGGINTTLYLLDEIEPVLEDYGVTKLNAKPGAGWVLEAGLNYDLNRTTFINLDLKLMDFSTDLDLEDENGEILDRVTLDGSPVEIGLGIGWRW